VPFGQMTQNELFIIENKIKQKTKNHKKIVIEKELKVKSAIESSNKKYIVKILVLETNYLKVKDYFKGNNWH
jgi:hypothetical protein